MRVVHSLRLRVVHSLRPRVVHSLQPRGISLGRRELYTLSSQEESLLAVEGIFPAPAPNPPGVCGTSTPKNPRGFYCFYKGNVSAGLLSDQALIGFLGLTIAFRASRKRTTPRR
jgi:hypothetical protein